MDIILKLSEELGIRKSQAEAAVKLIDEGMRHYLSVGVRLHARVLFRSAIMLSISCTGLILHSKPPVVQRCAVRANNKANMAVRIS